MSKDATSLLGVLYLGYPLIKTPEGTRSVPALLVSEKSGAIAFDVIPATSEMDITEAIQRQDNIYNELEAKWKKFPEILNKRNLAFKLEVVTFDPFDRIQKKNDEPFFLSNKDQLISYLIKQSRPTIKKLIFQSLKSIVQGVSKLRTPKIRKNTSPLTLGRRMKDLDEQTAVLDIYQNRAIIELTDSPQRITGLAGTGKTVVIAGKAAYLHAINPDLDIVVTFYSKTLYQQYISLITRLYFNHNQDEPNWKKIHLMHAWGGENAPGLYYKVATENGCSPLSYREAKEEFGFKQSWTGSCDKLLVDLKKNHKITQLYDVILIDEAQDMPPSFFEICYQSTREPHRVVWAYDELQQLNNEEILPEPKDLFGSNNDASPRFTFSDSSDGPEDDIILKVCYRNPKEIISTAHALGLGVYNPDGPFQMYEDSDLWNRIGYRVIGQLKPNNEVTLEREPDASPKYLEEFLSGTNLIELKKCSSSEEQTQWVCEQIHQNLTSNELQASDILVIFLGHPWNLLKQMAPLRLLLKNLNINTHIAGEGPAAEYFKDDSVAISQIYRAKGNEAPMVYILNAETCAAGSELMIKRNRLFTAITRARGWVRICGIGSNMDIINSEIELVKSNNNKLIFRFPEDLANRRKLHGELSNKAKNKRDKEITNLKSVLDAIDDGSLQIDDVPPSLLEKLIKASRKKG